VTLVTSVPAQGGLARAQGVEQGWGPCPDCHLEEPPPASSARDGDAPGCPRPGLVPSDAVSLGMGQSQPSAARERRDFGSQPPCSQAAAPQRPPRGQTPPHFKPRASVSPPQTS